MARKRNKQRVNNAAVPLPSMVRGSDGYSMFSMPSNAGVPVTESTVMNVSAVYACVQLISGAMASLPLPIYERTATGRQRVDHPIWWLLNEQPIARCSASTFWRYMMTSKLLHGDESDAVYNNNI
jgi:phage portal protein BeeE